MIERGLALSVSVASLLVTVGCTAGTDAAACPSPSPAPASESALMPEGLAFDRVGTVTHVVSSDGHVTVQAVTDKPIDEVTVLIQDAVTAAGYRPAGMDNEGFEAEVFFTAGDYAAGQALVRRSDCEGRWDVELVLVEPGTVPTTSPSPS